MEGGNDIPQPKDETITIRVRAATALFAPRRHVPDQQQQHAHRHDSRPCKPHSAWSPHTHTMQVLDVGGSEVQFKVKTVTKFHKIFAAYADKKSLDPRALK